MRGEAGYINHDCGLVDGKAGLQFLRGKLEERPNIKFMRGEIKGLVHTDDGGRVSGVQFDGGQNVSADLIVLAAGACMPELVGLGHRLSPFAIATASIELSEDQQELCKNIPIINNFSTGVFICPPKNRTLEIVRYTPGTENVLPHVSHPDSSYSVSTEERDSLHRGLTSIVPALGSSSFSGTQIHWNTETPNEDYLVTYHPTIKGLFIAAGGHAYKIFPVLGEEVVDILEGLEEAKFKTLWGWMENFADPSL